jgi:hypothetical protein
MRCLKRLIIGCMTIIMAGCAARQPPTVYSELPELPVRAQSLYEPYLECLGALLDAKGVPEVDVLIGGLDDKTRPPNAIEPGPLTFGGPQMTRTGLAMLAPRVIASTPTAFTAERITLLVKGAFTELDRTILSHAEGFAIRLALKRLFGIEISYDADRTFDIITLDIELARPDGRQLHGLASVLKPFNSYCKTRDIQWRKSTAGSGASPAGPFANFRRRLATHRQGKFLHICIFSSRRSIGGSNKVPRVQRRIDAARAQGLGSACCRRMFLRSGQRMRTLKGMFKKRGEQQ